VKTRTAVGVCAELITLDIENQYLPISLPTFSLCDCRLRNAIIMGIEMEF